VGLIEDDLEIFGRAALKKKTDGLVISMFYPE